MASVFSAASPTPSTLPDAEQALHKYLLNEYSNRQALILLNRRVFLLGRHLNISKSHYIKHKQQILGLRPDRLGFVLYYDLRHSNQSLFPLV